MNIYLAGPEVFLLNAKEIGEIKKKICNDYGHIGIFPFDNDDFTNKTNIEIAKNIFIANVNCMRIADVGVFNLTPFRGPSADVGTVWELGFMFGLGKKTYGYTNDSRYYVDRVERKPLRSEGNFVDLEGNTIENFNGYDNLMIDYSIDKLFISGRCDFNIANLTAFEECLKALSETL